MSDIKEGRVLFRFGGRWLVEKWDACEVYKRMAKQLNGELGDAQGVRRAEGTKAVDFVGVLDDAVLYLFEVKDFRGHRIENKKRQLDELPLEIGLKVRDTLAGITGEFARTGGVAWAERWGEILAGRKHQIHVVAWIADDPPGPREPAGKRAAHASVREKQVKQKLSWLTSRVLVEDPLETGIEDVVVVNLPGAGQP